MTNSELHPAEEAKPRCARVARCGARRRPAPIVLVALVFFRASAAVGETTDEFIYSSAPFPQCHASTLAETSRGLVAAWFGGTHEKHPDVGIWVARRTSTAWTAPQEVATGVQSEQLRYPCWNPVLHQVPHGPLLLFDKVGPDPSTWWGMLIKSGDAGRTWSRPKKLPDGILGPIKNKPVLIGGNRLLCGTSTEDKGWRVHMEWTDDSGATWSRTDPLNDGELLQAIQPTIFQHSGGRLQILCRAKDTGKLVSASSRDAGRTWTELTPTALPNPNAGIDGVTLADGRHLLVYNHTSRGRSPLNVALSEDGEQWSAAVQLESANGEYSYPAVIQTKDGLVHITYTWRRERVKHVVLDPGDLELRPIEDGRWPVE